jgi:hypothetical protein
MQNNIKPLFPEEKRQVYQIRVKKGIYELALKIAERLYPFAEKPDIGAFLEQAITITAYDLGLVEKEPKPFYNPQTKEAYNEIDTPLLVPNENNLLGGNLIDTYLDADK